MLLSHSKSQKQPTALPSGLQFLPTWMHAGRLPIVCIGCRKKQYHSIYSQIQNICPCGPQIGRHTPSSYIGDAKTMGISLRLMRPQANILEGTTREQSYLQIQIICTVSSNMQSQNSCDVEMCEVKCCSFGNSSHKGMRED